MSKRGRYAVTRQHMKAKANSISRKNEKRTFMGISDKEYQELNLKRANAKKKLGRAFAKWKKTPIIQNFMEILFSEKEKVKIELDYLTKRGKIKHDIDYNSRFQNFKRRKKEINTLISKTKTLILLLKQKDVSMEVKEEARKLIYEEMENYFKRVKEEYFKAKNKVIFGKKI